MREGKDESEKWRNDGKIRMQGRIESPKEKVYASNNDPQQCLTMVSKPLVSGTAGTRRHTHTDKTGHERAVNHSEPNSITVHDESKETREYARQRKLLAASSAHLRGGFLHVGGNGGSRNLRGNGVL